MLVVDLPLPCHHSLWSRPHKIPLHSSGVRLEVGVASDQHWELDVQQGSLSSGAAGAQETSVQGPQVW